ncbi:hypothetical protein JTE90_024746 [Oedothorax gibbosus]|uniref:DDE Tnp4 domain-containing protein n=1 Tax=Oedothorax gibbosus TaxID=931172 RepID=A0AAV6UAV8_9ARAC|nr:hypothetical protein JTE90_024746 [Oedothorax gibbosus]
MALKPFDNKGKGDGFHWICRTADHTCKRSIRKDTWMEDAASLHKASLCPGTSSYWSQIGHNLDEVGIKWRTAEHIKSFWCSALHCMYHNQPHMQISRSSLSQCNSVSHGSLLEIANSFLGLGGLPGVFGAVDGTHILIKAPSINAKEYYCSRKSHYSVLLQGVADHKKRFTNVYFGWPGSIHDARVLFNSPLHDKCESGEILDRMRFLVK